MIDFKKFVLDDYRGCLIVTDEKIARLYGINGDNVFCLPQGETAKSFAYAEKLCGWFLSKNLPRGGNVVAIGGGSVGDAAGFAASVYKRGVKLTHIPTTLVAQIDSSIGGKTAIDLDGVKNAVGTFYDADTFIDVGFLNTLDDVQWQNGRGELLKYRMMSKDIDAIKDRDISSVIKACVKYKARLCTADKYDLKERRKLNFGHTVGHALELSLDIPHGAAVANGLYYETLLAYKSGKCDEQYCLKWTQEIAADFTLYSLTSQILDLTLNDKKNDGILVGFVLPNEFSEVRLSLDKVKSLLL